MAEAPTYSLAQIIALAKGTTNWYEYAKSGAQHGKNNQDDISTLQSAAFSGATPGWQAAIDLRWYVADTSSSTTTYTGVTKPSATGSDSLFAGYFIIFKPANNNTGASTLNVASSDGAVDIKKIDTGAKAALAAGDLDSDTYAELIFDGTDWVLLNPPSSAGDFKLDDLAAPDDNTDLNFSTSAHGLVPKGTNTGDFLKDDGTWATAGDLHFGGDTFGAEKTIGSDDANHLNLMTNDKKRIFLRSDGRCEIQSLGMAIRTWNAASSTTEQIWCSNAGTEGSYGLGTGCMFMTTNGDLHNTNNSYGSSSDSRLKENIVDATSQWDDIKNIKVRKYNFRTGNGFQTHTQIGVIAQELESVSPGLVITAPAKEGDTTEDASGNVLTTRKTVSYSVLYMKAVKALQEAMTRIETLEAKVATLEGS